VVGDTTLIPQKAALSTSDGEKSGLGRFEEAQGLAPEVWALANGLGNELDLVRTLWLQSRVDAGLSRRKEALPALEQVKRYFTENEIAYDAAVASLEVAILYLEEERTRGVKRLAEELLWVFQGQGVHQEALAALRLFCEAARKEEATVQLTRRVVDYLLRSRHNPDLPFEP